MDIKKGVPQGFVLGRIIFIIYVNDLPLNAARAETCLYADETSLIVKADKLEEIHTKSVDVLRVANNWFAANKLKVKPIT